MTGNKWPLWWSLLHRLIRWIPAEPIDEINEHNTIVFPAGKKTAEWRGHYVTLHTEWPPAPEEKRQP